MPAARAAGAGNEPAPWGKLKTAVVINDGSHRTQIGTPSTITQSEREYDLTTAQETQVDVWQAPVIEEIGLGFEITAYVNDGGF